MTRAVQAAAGSRRAALAFLQRHGADNVPHLFGDLLSHLVGVEDLVRAWGGDEVLALAALGHASYGTDGFEPHLVELDERGQLRDAIGADAEALVYFYASCDRAWFYPQLTDGTLRAEDLRFVDRFRGSERTPTPDEVRDFLDLTLANETELALTSPLGPLGWSWLADFCRDTRRWASPGVAAGAARLLEGEG